MKPAEDFHKAVSVPAQRLCAALKGASLRREVVLVAGMDGPFMHHQWREEPKGRARALSCAQKDAPGLVPMARGDGAQRDIARAPIERSKHLCQPVGAVDQRSFDM